MKTEKMLKTTSSRSDFNRAYKVHLEKKGRIRCALCRYNKGENSTSVFYRINSNYFGDKYPNWKLLSRNRKQWMYKKVRIEEKTINRFYNNSYNYKKILIRNDY